MPALSPFCPANVSSAGAGRQTDVPNSKDWIVDNPTRRFRFEHARGDTLLESVAERFEKIIRGTDLAARWGGDELTLLLTGLRNLQECEDTVSRLIQKLAEPHHVNGRSLTLSASIGVALYPSDSSNGDTLLRHADHAMYLAKQRGRNTYQFFDPVTDSSHSARYDQERLIQSGIENGEMRLVYQPIVDMRGGGVAGVEALVRWHCPERGELTPIDFLPAIEGTAVIRLLDLWVLRQSLADLSAWGDTGAGLRVHVNLSAHSLVSTSFVDDVQAALARYPAVSAGQLVLEIIETAALEDLDAVSGVIRQGSALGLNFALDDFGTGYSSLIYFRHLPTELLKIDRSFVQDMLSDENDLRIVEAVIGLAAAFDRTVIAEGIESEAHGTNLLRMGCKPSGTWRRCTGGCTGLR